MALEERRHEVLNQFKNSRAALMSSIQGLSEQQMTEVAIDKWSIKDNLAHIAHMDELRASEIHRLSNGFEIAYREDNPNHWNTNDMGVDQRSHLSVQQVLWEIEFARKGVLKAITVATERGLDRSLYGSLGLDGGAEHEQEHAAAINAWRASKGI